MWFPTRPWFRRHVLAEARGDPPPEGDEVGVRELARRALKSLQRAEAEALIWEGLANNRLLDLAELSALDIRVIGRLVDIQEERQRGLTLPKPGAEIEEGALPTKPHPDVDAKIASKLGNMLEVRKTLETEWAWRVAAYTARKGLTDEEIQAVL